MTFRQWLAHRRAVRDDKDFNRGYEYAAGKLLSNRFRPGIIEELEAQALGFDGPSPFERGMQAALSAWYFMGK